MITPRRRVAWNKARPRLSNRTVRALPFLPLSLSLIALACAPHDPLGPLEEPLELDSAGEGFELPDLDGAAPARVEQAPLHMEAPRNLAVSPLPCR